MDFPRIDPDPGIISDCSRKYVGIRKCDSLMYRQRVYLRTNNRDSVLEFMAPAQEEKCIYSPKMNFCDLILTLK